MRLLVLGANGLLGSRVVEIADTREWTVTGTYHETEPAFDIDLHRLDIRRQEQFEELLGRLEPHWVVNCAAMTDVDTCEKHPDRAHEINGRAPGRLAEVCREYGVRFVHVSTDYVFDGEAERPYPEDANPAPVQVYGESKLAGEEAVREANARALVLRLSFVYGLHGARAELVGFPAWVRDRLERGEETPLFTDQRVTPTRAGHAADVLLRLIERDDSGTYHVASRSCVTPYEFGRAVQNRLSASDGTIVRGSMADLDRPARRPRYTCLDVTELEATLGEPQPTLQADLDAIGGAF
jgi:dTDP-4-dehydrorhamnose reductase